MNILDAACGSGNAVSVFYKLGYSKIEGLDYSGNMLDISQDLTPKATFHHLPWENIHTYNFAKKYDLVFITGMSLLHSNENNFTDIFSSIYNILNEKGIFICDVREWGEGDNNGVI